MADFYYHCGHENGEGTSPRAALPVQGSGGRSERARVVLCRACLLGLTGYPQELTQKLDMAFTYKLFGEVVMSLQNGVPGNVFLKDTVKVQSWQPWPRKNWLVESGEGGA